MQGRPLIAIADSGATCHVAGNACWFSDVVEMDQPRLLETANGAITVTQKGHIPIEMSHDGTEWIEGSLNDVLLSPSIGDWILISTKKIP